MGSSSPCDRAVSLGRHDNKTSACLRIDLIPKFRFSEMQAKNRFIVYRIKFVKTQWTCPWNSAKTVQKNSADATSCHMTSFDRPSCQETLATSFRHFLSVIRKFSFSVVDQGFPRRNGQTQKWLVGGLGYQPIIWPRGRGWGVP